MLPQALSGFTARRRALGLAAALALGAGAPAAAFAPRLHQGRRQREGRQADVRHHLRALPHAEGRRDRGNDRPRPEHGPADRVADHHGDQQGRGVGDDEGRGGRSTRRRCSPTPPSSRRRRSTTSLRSSTSRPAGRAGAAPAAATSRPRAAARAAASSAGPRRRAPRAGSRPGRVGDQVGAEVPDDDGVPELRGGEPRRQDALERLPGELVPRLHQLDDPRGELRSVRRPGDHLRDDPDVPGLAVFVPEGRHHRHQVGERSRRARPPPGSGRAAPALVCSRAATSRFSSEPKW